MKYEGGFTCDIPSKELTDYLIEKVWFSACTIIYDQENNNNEFADIDRIFTATTPHNKSYPHCLEIKDRKGYDNTGKTYENGYQYKVDDWMIEIDKYNTLLYYSTIGYISLYLNFFDNGYWALWKINKDTKVRKGYNKRPRKTQGDTDEIKTEPCYYLNYADKIAEGRWTELINGE